MIDLLGEEVPYGQVGEVCRKVVDELVKLRAKDKVCERTGKVVHR